MLGGDKLALHWSPLPSIGRPCGDLQITSVRMSSEPAILTAQFPCNADVDRNDSQNDAEPPTVCQPVAEREPVFLDPAPVSTDGSESLQAQDDATYQLTR